jgi:cobalt-zinc-cadmium efflux system outer membrane protein
MNTVFRMALLVLCCLAGCTTIPDDLGRSDVDALTAERGRASAVQPESVLTELIRQSGNQPLSKEDAVRITLLNNAELQASYARLGFAAADVYQAGRIRNPVLSASVLNPDVAGEVNQITLGLAASFTDLLTLSARKRMSASSFATMKATIGAEVMHKAAAAEQAWYGYTGAQQVEALRRQIALAADLSSQLAERYFTAGNITARELALERAVASEARLAVLSAASATLQARTELAIVMGLSSGADWTTAAELGLPLEREDELPELISLAEASRLDLLAARTETDLLADRLGVVNWTRWLGDLDIGIERERETDGARLTGPSLAWEIPIFTQNKDQQLRAEAEFKAQIAEVQRLINAIDNSVRLAHAEVLNSRTRINEYRDVLIPQRIESVARAQEELNFMLIGVFELLSLKQEEYAAYQEYLESVRDYWQSRARLSMAVGRTLPSSLAAEIVLIETGELLQSSTDDKSHAETDHSTMDHSRMNHSGMDQPGMDDPGVSQPDHSGHTIDDQGEQP